MDFESFINYHILDNYDVIQWLSDKYDSLGAANMWITLCLDIFGVLIISNSVKNNKVFVTCWNTFAGILLAFVLSLMIMKGSGWINMELTTDITTGAQRIYAGSVGKRLVDNEYKSLPDGYGRQFDLNGNLLYKGHFQKGLYHGKGIQYWPKDDADKRDRYEGEFLEGQRDGNRETVLDHRQMV